MVRPKRKRWVGSPPRYNNFKPAGVKQRELGKVILSLDELESIRLADLQGMEHVEAADTMEISRPTFTKLLKVAHEKVAEALIEGKMLIFEGGPVHFRRNVLHCTECGSYFKCDFQETDNLKCPNCGSDAVNSLAEQYGHGRCCHNRGK